MNLHFFPYKNLIQFTDLVKQPNTVLVTQSDAKMTIDGNHSQVNIRI